MMLAVAFFLVHGVWFMVYLGRLVEYLKKWGRRILRLPLLSCRNELCMYWSQLLALLSNASVRLQVVNRCRLWSLADLECWIGYQQMSDAPIQRNEPSSASCFSILRCPSCSRRDVVKGEWIIERIVAEGLKVRVHRNFKDASLAIWRSSCNHEILANTLIISVNDFGFSSKSYQVTSEIPESKVLSTVYLFPCRDWRMKMQLGEMDNSHNLGAQAWKSGRSFSSRVSKAFPNPRLLRRSWISISTDSFPLLCSVRSLANSF
jgi:hypothetical protein